MQARSILPQTPPNVPKITTQDILKSANWRELVAKHFPGADLQAWERMKRNFDANQANPKKKKSKKSPSRSGSSRRRMTNSVPLGPSSFETQTQRTGRSTAELVERANNKPDEADSRFAWLTVNGRQTVLEVC